VAMKRRLLVVGYDPGVRDLVHEASRGAGYEVVAVPSGEVACSIVEEARRSFDVVVVDSMMPGMGGMELLRWIGRASPSTRVLLTTGRSGLDANGNRTQWVVSSPTGGPSGPVDVLQVVEDLLEQAERACVAPSRAKEHADKT